MRHLAFPKSLNQGLGLWAPRDDGGAEKSLERKLAALRAALLNPMPYVGRLARKLRCDAIVLKPTIPRSIAKTSERDFWEERIAAAEEARCRSANTGAGVASPHELRACENENRRQPRPSAPPHARRMISANLPGR